MSQVESISEKSEFECSKTLTDVRNELERLVHHETDERRRLLEHVHSESDLNNQKLDKVLRNVSDRMDELDAMYDDMQVTSKIQSRVTGEISPLWQNFKTSLAFLGLI